MQYFWTCGSVVYFAAKCPWLESRYMPSQVCCLTNCLGFFIQLEIFTHLETPQLQVKGCKFDLALMTIEQWGIFSISHTSCDTGHPLIWSSPGTHDTHTCCQACSHFTPKILFISRWDSYEPAIHNLMPIPWGTFFQKH